MPPPDQLHLSPFQELPIETATLENRTYETRRFRCRAKVRNAGSLALAPVLQGTVIQETRSYFFVQRQQRPVTIPVDPLTLAIRPVPDTGRPVDFSGAIGRFSFQASAAPLEVAVGDLITVTLRIEGEGLPDPFTPPRVPETPGLKLYEVKPVPDERSSYRRVFLQTVVPTDASLQAVPPITFTFFDARAGVYSTHTAGPFPLTFHAERAPAQSIYTPPSSSGPTSPAVAHHATLPVAPSVGWLERLRNLFMGRQPAAIRGNKEVTVRFAPSDSAKPLFALKPGATVFREMTSAGWARISCHEGIGWIAVVDLDSRDR
jgi:hypothetical protein